MSVDEVEPIEAEAEEGNAVAPRGTHLASTQTVTHEYLTQSGKVMRETVKTDGTVTTVLDFIYDESGKPFAMIDQLSAQPKTYYYVLNLQGDVVKLIDQDGAVAAAYAYDAWGNILSQSGSMAEKNPLRYRGYYYDVETGFYYLQSRYYDPATRRFINADVYSSTDTSDAVSCNMFAYCGNNPTASSDSDGEFWHIVIGAVIGAVANALSTAVDAVKESGWDALSDGKTWAKIGTSALAGAINGGVTASGVGALAAGAVGGITGGLEEVAHQSIDAGRITVTDWKKVATKSASGFVSGYSSGGAARNLHYEKTLGFSSTITDRALAKVRTSGISAGYKYYMKNTWTLQKRVIKSIAKDAGEGVLKSFAKTATGLSSYI